MNSSPSSTAAKTSSSKAGQFRIVWITGASSGIGASLASVFAKKGEVVVATSRNARALKKVRDDIVSSGGKCESFVCDVRIESEVRRIGGRVLKKHGGIDVLINNAGITLFKDVVSTSVKEFDNVIATNLRGLFLATKVVLPSMMKQKKGLIINVLSFAAKIVYTKSAAYTASKSGGESLMNVLRAEVRNSGIKVVNVYPGAVLTPMWQAKHRKRYAERMMNSTSVAELVYEVSTQPPPVMVEEIIIRPQGGDLRV